MYSRLAYLALKAETTENVPVLPNVFMGITGFDVVTEYAVVPSSPILYNRNTKINPVEGPIPAPQGSVTIQIEPKVFGYMLKGACGAVSSGRYFPISGGSGTFVAGETITGGTSAATAVIVAISKERDYIIASTIVGTFTIGETITGGTSSATATLGTYSTSAYGHEFKWVQNTLPTFTVEIGYQNEAIRFTGVRFPSFNSLTSEDNILTAEMAFFARAEFKCARVTAILASGAGSKTILVDQTLGLVNSDTIKVFRPSTGAYLDFSASSVKTHTINSFVAETSINVTNLQTTLAVGDLIVLAPQTASYSVGREFSWIGGSILKVADSVASAITASGSSIEMFELEVTNEMEERHAANATSLAGKFPTVNHLKGFMGSGSLKKSYVDMTFLDRLRNMTQTAIHIIHTADQIGSTGIYYTLDWRIPYTVFQPWHPPMETDALLDEDMPFDIYRASTEGYEVKALLITDTTTF